MEQFTKSWRDIEEAALHNPTLHEAVTLVQMGRITQTEALIGATLALAEQTRQQHEKIMELINTRPFSSIILPRE